MLFRKRAVGAAILILICCAQARARDGGLDVSWTPIGMAYASTAINAAVFRCSSLVSAGGWQFVTYYDPESHIVVGRRRIGEAAWDLAKLATTGNVHDAHNVVVLGVSSDGILHLSYDQHGQALHYCAGSRPWDVHSFGAERAMTGRDENRVTYPQFVSGAGGELYFFYRDGASGNGSLCINRYDVAGAKWLAVAHPLIDGEGRCNPYWWRPAIGADGAIHLAWCWRDTPDAATNHDICYARSSDDGVKWVRSDGKSQALPITPENAEVVEAIGRGSNLINQCSAALDAQGRPHLAQYMNDAAGVPQYFHVWFDGKRWEREQVSRRTMKFSIGGGGSLAIPMSRPEIAISKSGRVYLITRDAEFGGGIRLYAAAAPYESWEAIDLATGDLGNWEPTYDLSRWRNDGVLSLFVLAVRQGNHERTTAFGAQEARVGEVGVR